MEPSPWQATRDVQALEAARHRPRDWWVSLTERLAGTGERDQEKRVRLGSHPLLARCPLAALRRVASAADEIKVAAGDVLVEQGRSAAWFFLIQTGRAEVARNGVRLFILGPGDHFGEVALLAR